MSGILLDHNRTTGVSTYYHNNPDQRGSMVIERRADIQPLIESNHAEVEATRGQKFGEGKRVARIPPIYMADLLREGKLFDQKYMREWFKKHPECYTFHNRNW